MSPTKLLEWCKSAVYMEWNDTTPTTMKMQTDIQLKWPDGPIGTCRIQIHQIPIITSWYF